MSTPMENKKHKKMLIWSESEVVALILAVEKYGNEWAYI